MFHDLCGTVRRWFASDRRCVRRGTVVLVAWVAGVLLAAAVAPGTAAASEPVYRIAFTWSPSGGAGDVCVRMWDGTGQVNLTNHPADDWAPTWSPDGTRIAFVSTRDGNPGIYVMNADGSNAVCLTVDPVLCFEPAWSPDGLHIAFTSFRDDPNAGEIYVMDADGGHLTNLTQYPAYDAGPGWYPDGSRLAFNRFEGGKPQLYMMDADGWNVEALTSDPEGAAGPAVSPDGTRIAFYSPPPRFDIYVMDADGTHRQRLTHTGGAMGPSWSPDGRKIGFTQSRGGSHPEIVMMDADGTNVVSLTEASAQELGLAWCPLLGPASAVETASWGGVKDCSR